MANTTDFLNDTAATLGGWSPDSQDWEPYYQNASKQFGVPEPILKAVASVESGQNPGAEGPQTPWGTAKGATQIIDPTAKALGVNPWDPRQSISATAQMLATAAKNNGGDWANALRQYQGGPDTSKWGAQNAAYVPKVEAALKAQGQDPSILSPTTVSANAEGVQSDSTSTYQNGKSASTDDFLDSLTKTLAPPQEQESVSPPPQENLSPQQSQQLQGIIANPPQPDQAVSAQPQSAVLPGGPSAAQLSPPPPITGPALPLAPQAAAVSPQGPAPVALAPPPAIGGAPNPGPQSAAVTAAPQLDPRWQATHPDELQAAANAPLPQPVVAAPPPTVAPNVNPGWDASREFANSIALGAPKYLAGAIGGGISALQGKGFLPGYNADMAEQNQAQQAYEAAHPNVALASGIAGPLPAEIATGGLLGTGLRAAEAAPGLIGGAAKFLGGRAAGALAGTGSKVAAGALQGGLSGVEGSQISPTQGSVASQAEAGAIGGGVLGGVLGGVGRALLPHVAPDIAVTADNMSKLGVNLPVAQLVPKTGLATVAGDKGAEASLDQYTRAVGNQIGLNQDRITSADIDQVKKSIGSQLDAVGSQTGIAVTNPNVGNPLLNSLKTLTTTAASELDPGEAKTSVMGGINRVLNRVANGDIDGPTYQRMTQTGSSLGNMLGSSSPIIRQYGGQIKNILNQGLNDTAVSTGNQAAVQQLGLLRNQYGIANRLEPIVDKTPSGILNPRQVGNAFAAAPPGTVMKTIADAGKYMPNVDQIGRPRMGLGTVLKRAVLPSVGAGIGAAVGGVPGMAIGAATEQLLEHGGRAAAGSNAMRNAILNSSSPAGQRAGALASRVAPSLGANVLNQPQNFSGQPYQNPFLQNPQQ